MQGALCQGHLSVQGGHPRCPQALLRASLFSACLVLQLSCMSMNRAEGAQGWRKRGGWGCLWEVFTDRGGKLETGSFFFPYKCICFPSLPPHLAQFPALSGCPYKVGVRSGRTGRWSRLANKGRSVAAGRSVARALLPAGWHGPGTATSPHVGPSPGEGLTRK